MCSFASKASKANNEDQFVIVIFEIPAMNCPSVHIFAGRAFFKCEKANNCCFFGDRVIVFFFDAEV